MKKIFFLLGCLILFSAAKAQSFPYGINYQGVARDANGNAKTNTNVNLRFTIAPSTSTTTIVYQETQSVITNSMGQFNAVIGTGTSAQTFSVINWHGNKYNLIVEINPGSGYVLAGNQTLQAVPYAFTAVNSDTAKYAKSTDWSSYAIYQETYATGTSVASVSGWNTRLLNSTQASAGTDISRSGSTITLAPGTYYVKGTATAYRINSTVLCLSDLSNNVVLTGFAAFPNSSNTIHEIVEFEGVITVASTSSYKINHYTQTAATNGLGVPSGITGVNETYTSVFIQKIH